MHRLGALALVTGCHGAPAAPLLVDAAPREVVHATRMLLVGELAEGIATGGAGDGLVIHATAPRATLDWSFHTHASGGTQTIADGLLVDAVDFAYAIPRADDYYLLLRNHDTQPITIDVTLELDGDLQWSWQ